MMAHPVVAPFREELQSPRLRLTSLCSAEVSSDLLGNFTSNIIFMFHRLPKHTTINTAQYSGYHLYLPYRTDITRDIINRIVVK